MRVAYALVQDDEIVHVANGFSLDWYDNGCHPADFAGKKSYEYGAVCWLWYGEDVERREFLLDPRPHEPFSALKARVRPADVASTPGRVR